MPEVYTWVLKGAAMFRILCVVAVLLASASVAAGESLFDAVKAGDTASVERLLASGAEIDSRDRDQATPLIAASLSDQPAVAELLLSKGADVMARNAGASRRSMRRRIRAACGSQNCYWARALFSKMLPTRRA